MKVLKKLNLKDVIFLDIETARIVPELQLDTPLFDSWAYKKRNDPSTDNEHLVESFKQEAGLHPEFARIVCISVGRIKGSKISLRTYNNEDERELLQNFTSDLEKVTDASPKTVLAGHAIVDFDIPFIFKRCLINQVVPHDLIDTGGLKPWEQSTVDTKSLWRAGSFSPTSLINIATAFGLPSPKDDISGAEVGDVYWGDDPNRVERISRYCEKDVVTTANIVRRCRFEDVVEVEDKPDPIQQVIESSPIIVSLFAGNKYDKVHREGLLTLIKSLSAEDQEKCFTILDSICSTAKGKTTKLKKSDVKELRELCK